MLNHERGSAALLVAGALVLLVGMAAVAVDYGIGLNERRQDQTAADLSVLEGALELALGSSTQVSVNEIVASVNTNVRTTSIPQWEACADPDQLPVTAAELGLTPATDCISFDTFSRVRVRVPDQDRPTSFARILGTDTISTWAPAEASSQLFPGEGSPPPFAVLAGYGAGDVVCLRTSSSGNPPFRMDGNGPGNAAARGTTPDPCDENEYDVNSEMFGLLDPTSYFDSNGEIACKSNVNDYFIATGVDHPLSSYLGKYGSGYTPGDPEIQDGTGCGGNPKNPVNGADTIPVKTGLTAQELRCGILTSRNGGCSTEVPGPPATGLSAPARFHQGDYVQSTYQFLGENMDNSALWDHFTTNGSGDVAFTSAPTSCNDFATAINNGFSGPAWDYYDKRDKLIECLNDYDANTHGQLFEDTLWSSGRFAFIPLLAEDSLDTSDPNGPSPCPDSGGSCIHIDDFVPVWLQTLYTQSPNSDCDDVDGNDWGMHHAGQENSCGNSNGNLDRLSAIVMDCKMLSQDVCDARPGVPSSTPGGDLTPTIRLTK